jgi:inorganic pyrophosphatase
MAKPRIDLSIIPPFDEKRETWNVIIETPRCCRNKYAYDEETGAFTLKAVLPEGLIFPYDFGFIPSTRADDGDPLDVLLLMDEPAFPGCLVPARLIGVMQAEQTEKDGESERNDRIFAVSDDGRRSAEYKTIKDLNSKMLDEIEQFFISYNRQRGKKFKALDFKGRDAAETLAEDGHKAFKKKR